MKTKIYIYPHSRGLLVTDTKLANSRWLISWHYSLDAALKKVERIISLTNEQVFIKANLYPADLSYVLQDYVDACIPIPSVKEQGDIYYLLEK